VEEAPISLTGWEPFHQEERTIFLRESKVSQLLWATCNLCAKYSLLSAFVNKISLKYYHAHLCLCCLWLFYATVVHKAYWRGPLLASLRISLSSWIQYSSAGLYNGQTFTEWVKHYSRPWELSFSAWAAIIRYDIICGLNNKNLFFTVVDVEVWDHSTSMVKFWQGSLLALCIALCIAIHICACRGSERERKW
jgi:hypothetical protein